MNDETTQGAAIVNDANANKGERPGGSNTDPLTGNVASNVKSDPVRNDQPRHANRDPDRPATHRDDHEATPNDVTSAEAVKDQRQRHEAFEAKRDERNAEGHAKNMEKIEREGELLKANAAKHVPTGKQDNGNTPIVDAQGNKKWVPPQVG